MNPFQEENLYIRPDSPAALQAAEWRDSRHGDAILLDKIASQPQAYWSDKWKDSVEVEVDALTTKIYAVKALPVFVAYNIPDRDLSGYSKGGASTDAEYLEWIRLFAQGIGTRKAAVIIEPDALAHSDGTSSEAQKQRLALLRNAVHVLKINPKTALYLDAGHSRWLPAARAAELLTEAGIEHAEGFSLNVSNFITTEEIIRYGEEISKQLGGKHFVVDTSRNGLGSTDDFQWCNPPGRALGSPPTTETGHPLVDAFLWIKIPGESDGECNGGPSAGVWWPEYALELAKRASW